MGNKNSKKEQSFIGNTLQKRADETNRQNFMYGPVLERLKVASQKGVYFVEATKEEMGPLGVEILTEQKLIVEETESGYKIHIRKFK